MKQFFSKIKSAFHNNPLLFVVPCVVALIAASLSAFYLTNEPNCETVSQNALSSEQSEDSSNPTLPTKTDIHPMEVLLRSMERVQNATSFRSQTNGSVSMHVLLTDVYQDVHTYRVITGTEALVQDLGNGPLNSYALERYLTDDMRFIRQGIYAHPTRWEELPVRLSADCYEDTFGNFYRSLTPYDLSSDSILSGYPERETDSTLTFSYEVDVSVALETRAKQLQYLGNLSQTPIFRSAKFILTTDKELNPLEINYREEYDIYVPQLGYIACKSDLTESFYFADGSLSIEQSDFYTSFFEKSEVSILPELSSGYSILNMVFPKEGSYKALLLMQGEEYPFYIMKDPYSDAILLHDTDRDLLLTEGKYYVSTPDRTCYILQEDLDDLISFLSSLEIFSAEANTTAYDLDVPDMSSGIDFQVVGDEIHFRMETQEYSVFAVIDLQTFSVSSAEIEFVLMDSVCRLHIEPDGHTFVVPNFSDSVQANSVSVDFSAVMNGESIEGVLEFPLKGEKFAKVTTDIGLVLWYAEDTVFLCYDEVQGFIPASQLSATIENFGVIGSKITFSSPIALYEESTDEESPFTIRALHVMPNVVSPEYPAKEDCVDLYRLSEVLVVLSEKEQFSFAGTFAGEQTKLNIDHLDLYYDQELSKWLFSVELRTVETDIPIGIANDGEKIYLDLGGLKLCSSISSDGKIFDPPTLYEENDAPLLSIQALRFDGTVLELVTESVSVRFTFEDNDLQTVEIENERITIELHSVESRPFPYPDASEYFELDGSEDLFLALYHLITSGGFTVEGNINIKAQSIPLSEIPYRGSFAITSDGLNGYMNLQIPYIPFVTSKNIPVLDGLKYLNSCTIESELFFVGDRIYVKKTIERSYRGIYGAPSSYTDVEEVYVTLLDFFADPIDFFMFVLNIEDISYDVPMIPMTMSEQTLPVSFTHEGNHYAFVWSAPSSLGITIDYTLGFDIENSYLTAFEFSLETPLFSYGSQGIISEYGAVDLTEVLEQPFDEYRPLYQ